MYTNLSVQGTLVKARALCVRAIRFFCSVAYVLYCLEWNKVKLCTHKRKNSATLEIGGTANFSMRVTKLSAEGGGGVGHPKRASRRYCAPRWALGTFTGYYSSRVQ